MPIQRKKMIVALDVDNYKEAEKLIAILDPVVEYFKIGSQLFTACGPTIVQYLLRKNKKVFLDLKFHDIPNTVASAVRVAVNIDGQTEKEKRQSIFMCTIHVLGGREMMMEAVKTAKQEAVKLGTQAPLIVGITVLTSESKKDNIRDIVLERARLAKDCGLSGVVASSEEAALIRENLGDDFVIVTPGIRPQGSDPGDQKRIATPFDAIKSGSDFLVVGRPIVQAADPLKAAKQVLDEIQQAVKKK
jgi:orotidine-5'-phosphate decarboxylase